MFNEIISVLSKLLLLRVLSVRCVRSIAFVVPDGVSLSPRGFSHLFVVHLSLLYGCQGENGIGG